MKLTRIDIALIFILCLGTTTHAQNPPEEINDFSGGMNISATWSRVQQIEAFSCLNWVLDDPVGALRPRPGYHAVTDSLDNHGRIWGLAAHQFDDNSSFLYQIIERDTAQTGETYSYCDLYVSTADTYAASDSLSSFLYPKPAISVGWQGNQFLFNGINDPLVVTGGSDNMSAAPMIPHSPGSPEVIPLVDGSGSGLTGEYFWAVESEDLDDWDAFSGPCWTSRITPLSYIKTLTGQKARIIWRYGYIADSNYSAPPADSMIWYRIWRTKANRADFDNDSLFVVDSLLRPAGRPDTIVFIDSIPDGSLGYSRRIRETYKAIYACDWKGQRGGTAGWALGSMVFLYGDSGSYHGTVNGGSAGEDHAFYTYYLVDRYTGATSDTARSMAVYDGAAADSAITVGVPSPPSSRYWRVLVRGNVMSWNLPQPHGDYCAPENVLYYVLDTIFDSATTVYWDTVTIAGLETHTTFELQTPPSVLHGAVVHESKMFAWDRDFVYPGVTDTPGRFPILESVDFGEDNDGGILWVASFEGYLLIYTQNSIWVLVTSDGVVDDRQKVTRGVGAVSPYSMGVYRGANIFLGLNGVMSESDGTLRENAPARGDLSGPIYRILERSSTTMAEARGIVVRDRYMLSYPGTDSTFVYSFLSGGWAVWSFDFDNAVLYDTGSATVFSSLCFTKPDDERVFILDEADSTDDGSAFSCTWEKRHLVRNPIGMGRVDGIVVQTDATVQTGDTLAVILTDENGSVIDTIKIDSLNQEYRKKYVDPTNNQVFHHLNAKIQAPSRPGLQINGIGIITQPAGLD